MEEVPAELESTIGAVWRQQSARVVAGLQARQGLPVDGGRTYAEQTLAWTSWWVGPAAVVGKLGRW